MSRPTSPPGPRGHWLLGHTLRFARDPMTFAAGVRRDHGDVVRLRFGASRVYMLFDPAHVVSVLRTDHANFIKHKMTRLLTPIAGRGLLTSEGTFWRRQRKLIQPSFQRQQIERYAEVMVDLAERAAGSWVAGRPLDVHAEMMALTLAIVARTLFGADVSADVARVRDAIEEFARYFRSPLRWFRVREWLPIPSTLRYRRAIRRLDGVVYRVIRDRRTSRGPGDPGDLLSRLLAARDDAGGGMTDRQVRDESVTLFLAGHETTALALTFAFALLAAHPEADARLSEELGRVLAGRRPTADDVAGLRYAEWVVRETLRLYPPAWAVGREAVADCEVGGYHAPRGTQVVMFPWFLHRDPRWFDDPESFRPERWDNDLARRLPAGAYLPFGDGPRVCIGNHFAMMEMVLVLATVARRYRLSSPPGMSLDVAPAITLRPKHPITMTPGPR